MQEASKTLKASSERLFSCDKSNGINTAQETNTFSKIRGYDSEAGVLKRLGFVKTYSATGRM